MGALDSGEFRRILGHYPTGVCVVTAQSDGQPVGMVVGSFTSVSLTPALVAFLPERSSTTWPKIEAAGHFCVNVLAEHQRDICKTFSSGVENRFEAASYRLSPLGAPIIEDVVAWIDCTLHAVYEAGDHFIAVGEVQTLDLERPAGPLLFLRGEYGTVAPYSA